MLAALIISIALFAIAGIFIWFFSLISEEGIGKWFLGGGVTCCIAGLIVLYIALW
ncbi:MAG: hypothetical protein PHW53_03610 [Patescibacteria group bacterium]|nr:hypothetical protein [Patescibacteria group bacterium]